MCGIAGFYGFEDKKLLKEMCDSIKHRGPDDYGYHIDKNISLGNRRLSIIDIAGGKQPIYNEDQSIVVVYNGEIYNFKEVREDLEKKGHRFSTNTDTEVLVHGYEEYDYDILDKINGMFAFALWDSKKKELLIARDRLGIKPLYYYWNGKVLVFASEMKAILKYKGVNPKISSRALHRYLVLRYIPGDITIIEGIKKLMPGHSLIIRDGNIDVKKYWEILFGEEEKSFEKCKNRIHRLLEDSVKMRLISDVPLGAFLSGGIDSSIIVALMNKFSDKVKTFSVGFDNQDYNELKDARIVSDHLGTDHQEIIIDFDKFTKILPKIAWHMDEPLADPAAIPTYYVSQLARKKVKVVLTGEGGDELFAGYPKYGMHRMETLASLYLKTPNKMKSLIKFGAESYRMKLDSLGSSGRFYLAPFIRNAMIIERQTSEKGISDDISSLFKPYIGRKHSIKEMQHADIMTWLPEDLLMKVDKMTMANSLEARVPFLDYKFVNLSMTIPDDFKIRRGVEKYILRKSFPELLPPSTLRKKKQGFSIPISDWEKDFINLYSDEIEKSVILKKFIGSQNIFNLITIHLWEKYFLN